MISERQPNLDCLYAFCNSLAIRHVARYCFFALEALQEGSMQANARQSARHAMATVLLEGNGHLEEGLVAAEISESQSCTDLKERI